MRRKIVLTKNDVYARMSVPEVAMSEARCPAYQTCMSDVMEVQL